MSNTLEQARQIINDIDAQMAQLFVQRMEAVEQVYAYKKEKGLPILDSHREAALLRQNGALVSDDTLRGYYLDQMQHTMALSRAYQQHLCDRDAVCGDTGEKATTLSVHLGDAGYDIVVGRGLLENAHQYMNLDRRVLIVTDSGVPQTYAETVAAQCKEGVICTIPQGEESKSLDGFATLLQTMLDHDFSRRDCVVAVGGGVVGDLAGFAASAYMRGIDFYNIPTTLLAQVDASVGGKTAVNFGGIKNNVGAFYQPKKVLVDPDLLRTLPPRQISNGLAEVIKMALTSDKELFALLETDGIENRMEEIILGALRIKKSVVEQDEKETGLRKVLNFGHTIGHGIEMSTDLYHGESVALGMLPMCHDALRARVVAVLKKYDLYRTVAWDWEAIAAAAFHDKKADSGVVTVVTVPEVGCFAMQELPCTEVLTMAKNCLEGLKA